MKKYVVGFMFDDLGERVLLIRKNRPDWQAGKANGVGGKIEEGEMPLAAMTREFEEETGVKTDTTMWDCFALMSGFDFHDFEIYFFRAFNTELIFDAITVTDEVIGRFWVAALPEHVPNLRWLIPMALEKQAKFVDIEWSSR